MTKCCECGKRVKVRNRETIFHDGKYWCKECFDKNFFICEDCGKIISKNEPYYEIEYDRYICEECRDAHYVRCENCDTYIREEDSYNTWDGHHVCESCRYDYYYRCNECDCLVHQDDAHNYDSCDYCPECYDNLDRTIYDYHDFDDFCSYKMPEESYTNTTYGFEIEVAGNRKYAAQVIDILKGHAVAMNDSSVDGFEIVTHPMTEQYFNEKFVPILDKALKFMDAHGFKGHNKGGIHIHVSSDPFNLHMIRNLSLILYGNDLDRNTWLMLSQRKESEMKSWARMTGCRDYEDLDTYSHLDYERHTALNWDDRTETYEFRIFNSNTRLERILKNFEIVLSLMAYAEEEKEGYADTKGYLRYVDNRKLFYPNLSAFMQEKGVIEHYNKLYTEEELEVA